MNMHEYINGRSDEGHSFIDACKKDRFVCYVLYTQMCFCLLKLSISCMIQNDKLQNVFSSIWPGHSLFC